MGASPCGDPVQKCGLMGTMLFQALAGGLKLPAPFSVMGLMLDFFNLDLRLRLLSLSQMGCRQRPGVALFQNALMNLIDLLIQRCVVDKLLTYCLFPLLRLFKIQFRLIPGDGRFSFPGFYQSEMVSQPFSPLRREPVRRQ